MNVKMTAARLLKVVLVGLVVIWSIFPIYLIISSSFKANKDIFSVKPQIFFFSPTLANYERLLAEWPQYFVSLWNSAIVTIGATMLVMITSSFAGSTFSRYAGRPLPPQDLGRRSGG